MASPPLRIACLLVPDLPLAALLRAHPELVGRPVAIASGAGPRAELLAVSREAAQAGVRPFTSVVHARAVCAELTVRRPSPDQERAARAALLDVALSGSSRVELAPPAAGLRAAETAVFADARGVAALFRSEAGFAAALAERARRLGLAAVLAVAGSRDVARIAARLRAAPSSGAAPAAESPVHVIPPGRDAAFLAGLPIDWLDPEDALADALGRFGLRRVGELLALPERALVARFGRRIHELLRRARAESALPPPPAPEPGELEEGVDLEVPLAQLEPLLFGLRAPLSRLLERLACRGLAPGELRLELELEGGGRDARRVGLAGPTRDPRVLLRLLALALESRPPAAPVAAARLATTGQPPRGDQLDFFRPAGPPPAALGRTLAELASLCGEGRVGAPALADAHRPDAFALQPFQPPTAGGDAVPATSRRRLGLRALRPPLPAQVRTRGGIPLALRSALANGDVLHCAGPWRTTGGWWSETGRFAFDHFDVQTEDGLVVRLRRDHQQRRWEIDGVYD